MGTDSKVKSPVKETQIEKRRSMEDKENAHTIDDDDVQIVDSPDEKHSDRRHRRRRRRHGSRSKHDRSGSNRRRSRSERGEEKGSRTERGEERISRNKYKSSDMSREDEADKKKRKRLPGKNLK